MLLTTTAGNVAALVGLDAMQVGRILSLIYQLGEESSVESEYTTRPGFDFAPTPPITTRRSNARD